MIKITSSTVIFSAKLGVAAALSYYLGGLISGWMLPILSEIGGLWSAISAIIVLRKEQVESYKSGLDRILGTLLGSVIGAIFLQFVDKIWLFPLAIFFTAFICFSSHHLKRYYVVACLACAVVTIVWQLGVKTNVWIYSLSRFIESVVGVVAALVIAHIPPYEK